MKTDKGIGGHHRAHCGRTNEWLTPPYILGALTMYPYGTFDLDPCASRVRPWNMAKNHFTREDDGLRQQWHGRVWMNPPYGPNTKEWLKKLSEHNNGIALIYARTETKMFFDYVWNNAVALLFLKGRLHFYHVNGNRAKHNSGGPSVLIAYGDLNGRCLKNSGISGKFISLRRRR